MTFMHSFTRRQTKTKERRRRIRRASFVFQDLPLVLQRRLTFIHQTHFECQHKVHVGGAVIGTEPVRPLTKNHVLRCLVCLLVFRMSICSLVYTKMYLVSQLR